MHCCGCEKEKRVETTRSTEHDLAGFLCEESASRLLARIQLSLRLSHVPCLLVVFYSNPQLASMQLTAGPLQSCLPGDMAATWFRRRILCFSMQLWDGSSHRRCLGVRPGTETTRRGASIFRTDIVCSARRNEERELWRQVPLTPRADRNSGRKILRLSLHSESESEDVPLPW
ncbi:hypothetical protein BD410DRAFT_590766 [Rickenella mellea]|uniref:Uncharacterized protein n=1 Tax=Rickenella mellea TaxID=50990 RepID=A0A4Y7PQM3_9AGAM|nr:hypothetical protein BD410DRAFT_590766 [Rickenella mellea]